MIRAARPSSRNLLAAGMAVAVTVVVAGCSAADSSSNSAASFSAGLSTSSAPSSSTSAKPSGIASSSGSSVVSPSASLSARPSTSAVRSGAVAARTPAQARKDVARVVARVPDGAAGVSAVNLSTGRAYTAGYRGRIWTASMYKLLVLETLLREHGPLAGDELDEAARMIENSDNAAGWSLWQAGGANSGLAATLRALGMRHSVADGSDPTFTQLTPADALDLVRALARPGMLSAASRAQALQLMRNVEGDQRWGVGVVADKGDDFANKNGWLSVDNGNPAGENDNGRWVVTSVGLVRVHGQQLLMAAMSEHNGSMSDGVAVVEALAKDAAAVVAP